MPDPSAPIVLHMKLDRATIRQVDIYAAERDMYRNEAAAQLIRKGVEASTREPKSTNEEAG